MTRLISRFLLSAMLAVTLAAHASAEDATRYYLIGNSLTWDTVPGLLDGDTQWHVDCGVTLPYIEANPNKPCVDTSSIWPNALRAKQYDFVSVQPHYGSTLAQDVETISRWMKMQPTAVFIIHSGWAFHKDAANELRGYAALDAMTHSPNYTRALIAELKRLHPDRELRQTLAQNLLGKIIEDIEAKQAPWESLPELYRDGIHMTLDQGRYLMHNAMRKALGQSPSTKGFETVDGDAKKYLDGVLALLSTSPDDRALLTQILSAAPNVKRAELIAKLSDQELQSKMTELLPAIQQAVAQRPLTLKLQAEVDRIGGQLVTTPSGPQWLYLATGDAGMEIFDFPTSVDMYNGNNPLKGRGGRNEQVKDAWLERLKDVKTLQKLSLANCAIQGDGLRHIAGLTNLRELNLTLTPVKDDSLKHLSGLTELRTLGLASAECTGTGFVHLKALRKLENVNFHHTPLNDEGLQAISQIPISDRLWFAHCHFTDQGAAHLAKLTQLKRCGIGSKEKGSTGEAVAALVQMPLVDLALLDNQADDVGIAHAAKIATLRKLDVAYAPTATDASLKLIAQMPQLEEFKIGNAQLTDEGLQALAASESLKKLTLRGLKKVTPAGIEQLRKARPELVIDTP